MKSGKWSGQMFSLSNFWEFDPLEACSLGPLFRKSVSIYARSAPVTYITLVAMVMTSSQICPNSVWKTWPRGWIINSKVWKTAVVYIRDQCSNSVTDNTLNSNYQLTKQNGLVCSLGLKLLIYIVWLEYFISGLRSYWDFRETGSPQNIITVSFPYFKNINLDTSNIFCSHSQWNTFTPSLM